eukprot:3324947-Amphidinium_carterae.1
MIALTLKGHLVDLDSRVVYTFLVALHLVVRLSPRCAQLWTLWWDRPLKACRPVQTRDPFASEEVIDAPRTPETSSL